MKREEDEAPQQLDLFHEESLSELEAPRESDAQNRRGLLPATNLQDGSSKPLSAPASDELHHGPFSASATSGLELPLSGGKCPLRSASFATPEGGDPEAFVQDRRLLQLPDELKEVNHWVCADGKRPVSPRTGLAASTTNPATWGSFEEARSRAYSRELGIGFVFTEDDSFVGIDLDNVLCGDREFEPHAKEIIEMLGSYTEISVSGRGLHIVARGTDLTFQGGSYQYRNDAGEQRKIELYRARQFFRMTGNRVRGGGASDHVESSAEGLQELLSRSTASGSGRKIRKSSTPWKRRANEKAIRELLESIGVDSSGEYVLCPLHATDTVPSMHIDSRGFYCFGCGEGGGIRKLRRRLAELGKLDKSKD